MQRRPTSYATGTRRSYHSYWTATTIHTLCCDPSPASRCPSSSVGACLVSEIRGRVSLPVLPSQHVTRTTRLCLLAPPASYAGEGLRNGALSVCLSVPFALRAPLLRVCCCGPGEQEISIDCCTAGGPAVSSSRCGQCHVVSCLKSIKAEYRQSIKSSGTKSPHAPPPRKLHLCAHCFSQAFNIC